MTANKKTALFYQLYQQPKIKTTLNLILSVLVSLFFIIFAIKPTITTITSLKKQLKDEQQVLSLLKQKIQALQSAEQTYFQNQKYFNLLDKALPKEPEISRFATQLNYLAKLHEIEIQSLSFSEFDLINNNAPSEKEKAKKSEIVFNIAFQTSWEKTKAFLNNLEKLDRLNKINNIKQSSTKNQENNISTTVEANIYFFRENGIL